VWGPAQHAWRHTCLGYASGQSAAERMPNGNTFVDLSGGFMYEVDASNQLVWQFNAGPQKAFRYTCDDPGIIDLLNDPCGITTDVEEQRTPTFTAWPNPTTGVVEIVGLDPATVHGLSIIDALGREVWRSGPAGPVLRIDLGGRPDGVYHLLREGRDGSRVHFRILLQH
jgi:hypothetical protein